MTPGRLPSQCGSSRAAAAALVTLQYRCVTTEAEQNLINNFIFYMNITSDYISPFLFKQFAGRDCNLKLEDFE